MLFQSESEGLQTRRTDAVCPVQMPVTLNAQEEPMFQF